jgi:hypothetical protein
LTTKDLKQHDLLLSVYPSCLTQLIIKENPSSSSRMFSRYSLKEKGKAGNGIQ